MLKRFLPLLALISLTWLSMSAQDTPKMSLKDAIDYAMQNDLSIQNSRLNISDAEERITESRAVGIPKIDGDIDYQYYFEVPQAVLPETFEILARDPVTGELPPGFSRQAEFAFRNNLTFGIGASGMIFDGSFFIGLRAAKLYRQYVGQELAATERSVRDRVLDAYLPPLIIDENLKILDKNITNLEKILNETKETYKEGFVEQLDVDRLELSMSNLQTERDNLVRQRDILLNALKMVMGYPMKEAIDISDDIDVLLIEASEEDLVGAINFYQRPEYKVAETGLQLNEANIDLYRVGYLPTVNAFVNYQYGYQGNQLFHEDGFWAPTSLAGINVKVPIFDGFDKRAKIERARIALSIAQNQKKSLERLITLEVQNARASYQNAKKRVEFQNKNVALAERIYNTTQIKYKEGVGSSLEVTQAEQALYQTQQNYIQARFELLTAKSELDKALGKDL
ncbi:MAG: TolC family protein [Bacteroidota bacterium]